MRQTLGNMLCGFYGNFSYCSHNRYSNGRYHEVKAICVLSINRLRKQLDFEVHIKILL